MVMGGVVVCCGYIRVCVWGGVCSSITCTPYEYINFNLQFQFSIYAWEGGTVLYCNIHTAQVPVCTKYIL